MKVNQNYNAIFVVFIGLILFVVLVSNNSSFAPQSLNEQQSILTERAQWRDAKVNITNHASLPNFSEFTNVKQKKTAFFNYLKPLVENENSQILKDKVQLKELQIAYKQSKKLSKKQQKQLDYLARFYRVDKMSHAEMLEKLSLKVDIIPEALVLVQAANESAWGTSRFAVEANNLFGQWCFSKGCGLVPTNRSKKSKHEVRKFKHVQESIISYIRNLNTHFAYKKLRKIRHNLRQQKEDLSAITLAKGLENYSERGAEYVSEIILMIKQNRLE